MQTAIPFLAFTLSPSHNCWLTIRIKQAQLKLFLGFTDTEMTTGKAEEIATVGHHHPTVDVGPLLPDIGAAHHRRTAVVDRLPHITETDHLTVSNWRRNVREYNLLLATENTILEMLETFSLEKLHGQQRLSNTGPWL